MTRRWLGRLTRRTVVVNTTDHDSIRGVLLAVHADCLVVTQAMYLGTEAHLKVDGDAVIPREKVAWIQLLPTPDPAGGSS